MKERYFNQHDGSTYERMAWELRDGRWIGTESGTGKRMIVIEKLLAEKGLGQSV